MKKCRLPKIKKSSIEKPVIGKSFNFSSPFSLLLKQFKLKDKNLKKTNSSQNKNINSNYNLTEPNVKNTYDIYEHSNFSKKEEDKIYIEGQKFLIKLYDSNHTSIIDKIKNEENTNTENIKKPNKTEVLPSININMNDNQNENIDNMANNNDEKDNENLSSESRKLSAKNISDSQ